MRGGPTCTSSNSFVFSFAGGQEGGFCYRSGQSYTTSRTSRVFCAPRSQSNDAIANEASTEINELSVEEGGASSEGDPEKTAAELMSAAEAAADEAEALREAAARFHAKRR